MKRQWLHPIPHTLHIFTPYRSTTYVHTSHCYQPNTIVGLSVTLVSPAKTALAIKLSFGLRTPVGPRNHVLHGAQISPWEGAILRGNGRTI